MVGFSTANRILSASGVLQVLSVQVGACVSFLRRRRGPVPGNREDHVCLDAARDAHTYPVYVRIRLVWTRIQRGRFYPWVAVQG